MDANAPDSLPHIYALIAKAVATPDSDEFDQIMTQLKTELKAHIQRARAMAASTLLSRNSRNVA